MIGGKMAEKKELIKNIPFAEAVDIKAMVDYEEGRVVSRTLAAKPGINITLFAFDKKEEISAHTSPGDAMVQILDGEALINIDGEEIPAVAGQVVVMPAKVHFRQFRNPLKADQIPILESLGPLLQLNWRRTINI